MKKILGYILHLIGFFGLIVFLVLCNKISIQAWFYAVGASCCTMMFAIGFYLEKIEE